ncbi:hypothetical protein [Flavobacterium sp. 102]|jgi:hypothetical protein|nr:hypothetical protein [Flavobacterium sp. 102]RKS03401.1 hypothetical protein C8C84_3159 [Flavobacterium sp. 102]
MKKQKIKKPINAFDVMKTIGIIIACSVLILGIVGRVMHYIAKH